MMTNIDLQSTPFSKRRPVTFLSNGHSLSKFITAPKEYIVLGLIRQGMAFGLLAVGPSNSYVRVNGNCVEPLHSRHANWLVRFLGSPHYDLISEAELNRGRSTMAERLAYQVAVPVIVKRKRWSVAGVASTSTRDFEIIRSPSHQSQRNTPVVSESVTRSNAVHIDVKHREVRLLQQVVHFSKSSR